jgi:dTMP kinase
VRPLFVTFEGIEGCGKSTQVELLGRALAPRDPLLVREPGGTELGEGIRNLVLHGDEPMAAEAEMYLYMAARAELLERRIKPALTAGRVVVADHYHDSTLAYQGGGRGARTFWPEEFPLPDRTFLLALPAERGLERRRGSGRRLDRLESEPLDFHRRVEGAYEELAARDPSRWVRLDAEEPADRLHARILDVLSPLLEPVSA